MKTPLAQKFRGDLLTLARRTLEQELLGKAFDPRVYLSKEILIRRGLFVTLNKAGELRGCIGSLEASQSLFDGVQELALAAAFKDRRFRPVTAPELEEILIEISVLSQPREIKGKDSAGKLSQVRPHVDGVILKALGHRSTFLPQVWDQIPRPEEFLSQLCRKAGLDYDHWQRHLVDLEVYQAEFFHEN